MSMQVRTRVRRSLTIGAVTSVLALGALPALAADGGSTAPDPVDLMGESNNYWTPLAHDTTNDGTKAATAFRGTVLPAGEQILEQNDTTLVAINHAGAADETQAHRALVDADYDWRQTLPDALGPVLGTYFSEGVAAGDLPLTTAAITEAGAGANTGTAKPYFNFPRPFMEDRISGGDSDLRSLSADLGIAEIPDWTDPATDRTHTAGYASLPAGYSQAFPSGHTTYADTVGLELATLLPQLGTEIVTRSSEAGNNRIVLGVHYPLDVMGGRIVGHSQVAAKLSDPSYVSGTVLPAQSELADYLASRCAADGHGDTLEECIDEVGAADEGGYTNAFTDAVSQAPVTDRASALTAYRARMTYGFAQVGTAGQTAVVPEGAENLLVTAFPTLSADQRRAVLAATEIDSDYPLDSSSLGWQRIDLPAALSAKVTLDADGTVVSVETGQATASVVTEEPTTDPTGEPTTDPSTDPVPDPSDQGTVPTDDPTTDPVDNATSPAAADTATASVSAAGPAGLAHTGSDAACVGVLATLLAVCGIAAAAVARRRMRD